MAIQTTSNIQIGSTGIQKFVEFSLQQKLASHHFFQVVFREDLFEEETSFSVETNNLLGETITLETRSFSEYDTFGVLNFKGIITKVQSRQSFKTWQGNLTIIEGYSTSVLLDTLPHYNSFIESDLSQIISETTQTYDASKLNFVINPTYTDTLVYSVQSNESDFNYLKRLAAQYSQWFFYDGLKLHFGELPQNETVRLEYGVHLHEFTISLNPKHNVATFFSSDYHNEQVVEVATADVSSVNTNLIGAANSKSEEIYTKEVSVLTNLYDDASMQNRLTTLTENQKNATEVQQVRLVGKSNNPGVVIGAAIDVTKGDTQYGTFRVISVQHHILENGDYVNDFEAISDTMVYPMTNISAYPKSATQIAKVFDNVDPEGMSRVQVQFPWQVATNTTSPWLRVLTPHSGADKGFHFIPEVEEEVLIGFEGGNAERPFIMGALYTGVNKPEEWQSDANNIKAIRTRSGHTIELNDTEGEEKISIYDNEGSIIIFDTVEKSLTINATENIDIAAKNINITAEENITIGAQQNVEIAAETDVSAIAQGDVKLQSSGDTGVKSNGAIAIEATADATLQGMNAIVEGKTGAEVNGVQTKISGSAMTEVSGAIVKVN